MNKRISYYYEVNYGITFDQYMELHERQKGLCAICGKPETVVRGRSKGPGLLSVDHDHKTGLIRGLLCSRCNAALGMFGDDVDILIKAELYLHRHKESPIKITQIYRRVSSHAMEDAKSDIGNEWLILDYAEK